MVAQTVSRSPPPPGVPSLRLGHFMRVSWWTELGLDGFSRGFCHFPILQISFRHFSKLISPISFYFISTAPVVVATGILTTH